MQSLKYRRTFADANVGARIAAQLHALRKRSGMSQEQLSEQLGMAQARISLMEKPDYQKYNLKTLKRIAAFFDVALVVEFVSFRDLVNRIGDRSPSSSLPLAFKEEQKETGFTNRRSARILDLKSYQLLLFDPSSVCWGKQPYQFQQNRLSENGTLLSNRLNKRETIGLEISTIC